MGTATTHDRSLKVLRDPYTGPLVAEYFMTDEDGTPWFTGAWFERLGGGGDSPETRDVVTAADLVAVGTLAVAASSRSAIWILGPGSQQLGALLRDIPVDRSPADAEGAGLLRDHGSPLYELWKTLERLHGVGWVTAGKVCARKRPALAPVYDQHVRAAAGEPKRWWNVVADLFEDDKARQLLRTHQETAGAAGGNVTLLRALDIAVWMRMHGYRWARPECRPDGPLVIEP